MNQGAENRGKMQRSSRLQKALKTCYFTTLVSLALGLASPGARGAVDVGVNDSYNGTAPKSSATPWINALFQDIGPNVVRLTITAPNLSNPELLQGLYLNFNDTKRAGSLSFSPVFGLWQGVNHDYGLHLNQNGEQASTGGEYDILLNFTSSRGGGSEKEHLGRKDFGGNTFGRNDQVVFDITTSQGATSLSSFDFAFLSVPGSAGSFYAAAFIERTGFNHKDFDYAGATSFSVLGVPEPASGLAAAGLCVAGFVTGFASAPIGRFCRRLRRGLARRT
jgi:hypothetical protein